MRPAEATVELARCTLNLGVYRSRAIPLLADVAGHARAYRLISGDIGDSVRVVSELTGASVPAS
jgi:hypothetical protein